MPDNSYEFSYMSAREKKKVLVSKCILALLMLLAFYWLIAGEANTLSSELVFIGGILAAIFGYINILTVKSELVELFEPPYTYRAGEFAITAIILNVISWFV
ncbi:MAG: hypothetical protein ABGY96_30285 [bacterium]|nr:hypothetical protein [Gammaproteobacteria bacterium]